MGRLKQLSAGSSQTFVATLFDMNDIAIAASKVHVKGRLYTSATSFHEFEINDGAATGVLLTTICLFLS